MSTPRLDSETSLNLALPFDDEVIDDLFRLKTSPRPWPEIKEMLRIPEDKDALMQSFLTDCLAEIRLQEGEPLDNALRRFKRKVLALRK